MSLHGLWGLTRLDILRVKMYVLFIIIIIAHYPKSVEKTLSFCAMYNVHCAMCLIQYTLHKNKGYSPRGGNLYCTFILYLSLVQSTTCTNLLYMYIA